MRLTLSWIFCTTSCAVHPRQLYTLMSYARSFTRTMWLCGCSFIFVKVEADHLKLPAYLDQMGQCQAMQLDFLHWCAVCMWDFFEWKWWMCPPPPPADASCDRTAQWNGWMRLGGIGRNRSNLWACLQYRWGGKKWLWGGGGCYWKATPCVWSPRIRCPIERRTRTMLIFKSFGCLFKVSNWYLPLEEFSPIWHRVWEQGESSLPCLPAVGMCYATGNTLAPLLSLLRSSLQRQHQTTHTAHFYGFRLRIPSAAAKLPITETFNKQAKKCNAFVWLGAAAQPL